MKIEAIILARGGSKGIPNKNIMDFCGIPLISWTIKQCINSQLIDKITVSSDSKDILKVAKDMGVNCLKRPYEYSNDCATSESAITHWLDQMDNKPDYVVFPQVTSPLREKEDLDYAIKTLIHTDAYSLFSACKLDDCCIWDDTRSITYNHMVRGNRQNKKPLYLENGSIYIFKPNVCFKNNAVWDDISFFKEKNNRLKGNIVKYMMPFWKSYEIDTPDDIEICEYYMNKIISKEKK